MVVYFDWEYACAELFCFLHLQDWYFVVLMKEESWCKMTYGRSFQIGEILLTRGSSNFEEATRLKNLPTLRLRLNCE